MPNFKTIGGGPWKNCQKSVDVTWNDPYSKFPLSLYADTQCECNAGKRCFPEIAVKDRVQAGKIIWHNIMESHQRTHSSEQITEGIIIMIPLISNIELK